MSAEKNQYLIKDSLHKTTDSYLMCLIKKLSQSIFSVIHSVHNQLFNGFMLVNIQSPDFIDQRFNNALGVLYLRKHMCCMN